MIKIIDVNKSEFIDKTIDIYSSIKFSQYSKFLSTTPFFVTYISVNEAMSTSDIGTQNIDNLIGQESPIRYNKINNLPIYNLQGMKPEFEMSENYGADINIELNGLVLLPGTVKPNTYDLLIISYPNAKQALFRVGSFEYNSIQSNDFYTFNASLFGYYADAIEESGLVYQIEEEYETIFENIGTQNTCFIRSDKVEKINSLVRTIETLKSDYINKYYNPLLNSFVISNADIAIKKIVTKDHLVQIEGTPIYSYNDIEISHEILDGYLYDMYLENFITNTHIFETGDASYSLCLYPNDSAPFNFKYMYQKTLYHAIEECSMAMCSNYMYYYLKGINSISSPFVIYSINAKSIFLIEKENNIYDIADRIKKMRESALDSINKIFDQYQKNNYSDDNWEELNSIYTNASIVIYTLDNDRDFGLLINDTKEQMKQIISLTDEEVVRVTEQIISYRNRINMELYDEDGKKEISDITNKYISITRNAPLEVIRNLYDSYKRKIVSIDRGDNKHERI